MSRAHDDDVKQMTIGELRRELMRYRRAIRKHRDAEENARCWHNDLRLYEVLPGEKPAGKMVGLEATLLQNCKTYIRRQQCNQHGCESGERNKG